MEEIINDQRDCPDRASRSRRGFALSLLSAFGLAAAAKAREALGPDPVSIHEAAYYEPLPEKERGS